jgi:hypothetical protein
MEGVLRILHMEGVLPKPQVEGVTLAVEHDVPLVRHCRNSFAVVELRKVRNCRWLNC